MTACACCGRDFKGRRQARYCSSSCRQQAYRGRKTVTPETVTRETVTRCETVTRNCNAVPETVTPADLDRLDDLAGKAISEQEMTEAEITEATALSMKVCAAFADLPKPPDDRELTDPEWAREVAEMTLNSLQAGGRDASTAT